MIFFLLVFISILMPISASESSVTISGFHLHPYHLLGLFTSSCMLHGTFSTLDFTHRHRYICTLLHPFFTAKAQHHSYITPYGICGEQSGSVGQTFLQPLWFPTVSASLPVLYTHISFLYQWQCSPSIWLDYYITSQHSPFFKVHISAASIFCFSPTTHAGILYFSNDWTSICII